MGIFLFGTQIIISCLWALGPQDLWVVLYDILCVPMGISIFGTKIIMGCLWVHGPRDLWVELYDILCVPMGVPVRRIILLSSRHHDLHG